MSRALRYRHTVIASLVAGACLAQPVTPAVAAPGCDLDGVDDRCELWSAAYDHPGGKTGGSDDWMTAMAIGENVVYVAGESWDDVSGSYGIAIQALDGATGKQVWVVRHDSMGYDAPGALAVDSEAGMLVVAGMQGVDESGHGELVTIGYDATTGARRWIASRGAPELDAPWVGDMVIAGGVAFVVGHAPTTRGDLDVVVLAYDVATGGLLWETAHAAPASNELAFSVLADEEGVYVAGISTHESIDYLAIAYGRDGALRWSVAIDGGLGLSDELSGAALSSDGDTLYVTGTAERGGSNLLNRDSDIQTVALDTRTGATSWRAGYSGPNGGSDLGYEVVVGPRTGTVYVTGVARGEHRVASFATIAYAGDTGAERWATRTPFAWGQGAVGIAVPLDESRVYVTGHSASPTAGVGTGIGGVFLGQSSFTSIAYESATGVEVWQARHTETVGRSNYDLAWDVGVSPDGSRVYVAGTFGNRGHPQGDPLEGWNSSNDFGTVAYER